MKLDRAKLLISTAIALLPIAATHAQAQAPTPATAPVTDPVEMANNENSEEIIVTAQKRDQFLVDIPQSITVVSGATLENQQATNFQDYLKLVPGLQLDQSTPGAGRLILRGINTGGVASTVAVYVDETPFGSSTALANGGVLAGDFDTFDVARIEVLRGPQGTLYGASSLGGLLKFVTNAPDPSKLEARGRVAIEDTKGGTMSYRGNAVINIPINDMLAVRATGFYNKLGGFIDSIGTSGTDFPVGNTLTSDVDSNINDSKSYGGRASVLFKPSESFDLRLTAFLQNIRADAPSTVESDPDTLRTRYGRLSQSQFAEEFTNIDYRVYNGLLNYDFGFATLTSSTSYSTQKQTFRNDATFALSGFVQAAVGFPPNDFILDQHTNNRRYTQEVRLTSAKDDFFEWLVGGYYTDERAAILQQFKLLEPGTTTEIETEEPVGNANLRSRYKEYAGFANATLHFGEQFDLEFGGRYSHNKQRANQTTEGTLAGGAPITNLRSSDNVFTYSVAPKFKISDRASLYARVAKGYRPGGPNVVPPAAPSGTPTSFDPDTVVSYEVGFKGETDDRTFALDLAVYHIDWKNIQLAATVNGFGVNVNGGAAKSDGVEFTATVRPTPGFEVSFNGAYTRARLTEDAPPDVGGEDGDRLPFTPPYSFTVDANYSWAIGEAKPFVGGSLRFLSDQSGDFDAAFRAANGRQRKVPSYDVVDLRAGVDFGRFGVEAFVRNLTDAHGKTSTGSTTTFGPFPTNPNGSISTGIIRPRTIGLSVNAGF